MQGMAPIKEARKDLSVEQVGDAPSTGPSSHPGLDAESGQAHSGSQHKTSMAEPAVREEHKKEHGDGGAEEMVPTMAPFLRTMADDSGADGDTKDDPRAAERRQQRSEPLPSPLLAPRRSPAPDNARRLHLADRDWAVVGIAGVQEEHGVVKYLTVWGSVIRPSCSVTWSLTCTCR